MIYDLLGTIAVFVVALGALTYGTAYVADITGLFRLLFVASPYRQVFRACRWVVAALLAALTMLTLAE